MYLSSELGMLPLLPLLPLPPNLLLNILTSIDLVIICLSDEFAAFTLLPLPLNLLSNVCTNCGGDFAKEMDLFGDSLLRPTTLMVVV